MHSEITKRVINQGACLFLETHSKEVVKQWHSHPEYELIYINRGNGTLKYGSATTQYSQGDLFLLGSWVPHLFVEKGDQHHSKACLFHAELLAITHFQCSISREISSILEESTKGIRYTITDERLLSPNTFFESLKHSEGIKQAIDMLLFMHQLIDLKLPYEHISQEDNLSDRSFSKKHSQLQKIIIYIKNHIDEEHNINSLSERFYISRSSLSRLFNDTMQMGVSQYITQQRLSHACFLLSTTSMSITEISEKVGFRSLSSFNRNFLKFQGVSPRNYRLDNSRIEATYK